MAERWVEREDGVLQCVDDSGAVVAVQKAKPDRRKRAPKPERPPSHFVLDDKGRKIWVPRGTNPDDLPRKFYPFSDVTWEHVCRLVMEGKTLTEIGKLEEFPPTHILFKWKANRPDYETQYLAARRARAELRADKVMAIANQKTISEKRAPGERLRSDLFKWGAEMDDRSAFGKQTKIVGDASQPIVFQVVTGVPAPLPHQQPPQLGPDGRVIATVVEAEHRVLKPDEEHA